MDRDQQHPASRGYAWRNVVRSKPDPLLVAILGTAIGLALLILGLALFWGSGSIRAELPWYVPLMSAFVALTTLSIAYLASGAIMCCVTRFRSGSDMDLPRMVSGKYFMP